MVGSSTDWPGKSRAIWGFGQFVQVLGLLQQVYAFTVISVDTALRCMHAAMIQAPVWYAEVRGRELDTAVAELTDTLMMLVGEAPV